MKGLNKIQESKMVEIMAELGFSTKAEVRKELKNPCAIQAFLDFADDAENRSEMDSIKVDFVRNCQKQIASAVA